MAADKQTRPAGKSAPVTEGGSTPAGLDRARALANNEPVDGVRRPERDERPAGGPDAPQKEPQGDGQGAMTPEGWQRRQRPPTAPPPHQGSDAQPLRLLEAALAVAADRRAPPTAPQAALEAALLVNTMRASRQVQQFRAEVLDYLQGRVEQQGKGA